MALCACFSIMRELSRTGFVIDWRSGADRISPSGLYVTCETCGDRYGITPTRAKTADELTAAQGVLVGVSA